jgi:Ca2+-binding RTX toxin-like protein
MAFTQTIEGTAEDDELNGADEGDDFIYGRGGNDIIIGYGRHDYLFGGTGDDILDGGIGNDWLIGGPGADTLIGGSGVDRVDYSASARGITITLSGGAGTGLGGAAHGDILAGIESIYGSAFNDVMEGDQGPQTFSGLGGNDTLSGGANADGLDGGAGDDDLSGGEGDDSLHGGLGADILDGGAGIDIASYYGAPVLVDMLRQGRNTGDAAGDQLIGIEVIHAGDEADTLLGDNGDNQLYGHGGADVLRGRDGDDLLRGGGADDRLYGDGGNDVIEGGGAYLDGGAGDDVLGAFLGFFAEYQGQRMRGGDGADVFHTNPMDNTIVRIVDFESGVDTLDLFLTYAYLPSGALAAQHFVMGTSASDGDDHLIYDPATGRLWFDTDGAGGSDAYLFAVLTSRPELSAADIFI